MLDFDKPIQTRDGRKVRVLCTDIARLQCGTYPIREVVAAVMWPGGVETVETFTLNGEHHGPLDPNKMDLINVPETKVVWVNMYPKDRAVGHDRKLVADNGADNDREACIRVEYTVGQFDE